MLFGMKEWSYMMTVVGDNRYDLLKKVMAKETPVVIVARNLEIPSDTNAKNIHQNTMNCGSFC